jgi:hypothetical protein
MFLEHCFRCLSDAPEDAWVASDWLVLLTREGEYLGIVCAGCIADDELALLELQELYEIAA